MKCIIYSFQSIFFYFFILLLFLFDLCLFGFFNKPVSLLLLCYFLIKLPKGISFLKISISLLLLGSQSLLSFGLFGVNFIYLIPISILGTKLNHWFYKSIVCTFCLFIFAFLAHLSILILLFNLNLGLFYTGALFFANIVVITIFSLKF